MDSKIHGLSLDIERSNQDKLRAVFPECFTEEKLDIDKLLSLCGEYIDNDFEKYKFEWKGKSECLRLAQKRSTGTLRPCPKVEKYIRNVQAFADFVSGNAVTKETVIAYNDKLVSKNYAVRGINSMLAGISNYVISKMNKGENITVDNVGRICSALDCTPNDIMEFSNDSK